MSDVLRERLGLSSEQLEVVERFFASPSPVQAVLRGPVGTGKTLTASAIGGRALEMGASGVAVLGRRRVVAESIAWRAAPPEMPPFELTQSVLMAMKGQPARPLPVSRSLVFGTLKQSVRSAIGDAFLDRPWDVLIVDMSGGPDTESEEMLRQLVSRAQVSRLLVMDDWPPSVELAWFARHEFRLGGAADGSESERRVRFSVVNYLRSSAEQALIGDAQELTSRLRPFRVRPPARVAAAASSSPLALQGEAWRVEQELRALRNRWAHGLGDRSKDLPNPALMPDLDELRETLLQLADKVDAVETDSKYQAFASLLAEQQDGASCVVFCEFARTASYVAQRLSAAGRQAVAVTGESALHAIDDSFDSVLVCFDEVLEGLDLRSANVAFNYDLPASVRRAHLRWSRLDWARRHDPPQMVSLFDQSGASHRERYALMEMRYLVGGE